MSKLRIGKTLMAKLLPATGQSPSLVSGLLPSLGILAVLLLVGMPASAASLEEAEYAIVQRIESAEQMLNETELKISNERSLLVKDLRALENEIRALREETASKRRLADEATLTLEQLETRLQGWEEQNRFQQNLLGRFAQQVAGLTWAAQVNLADKISWLEEFVQSRQQSLHPDWTARDIIASNGEVQKAEILSLGPVNWFWQQEQLTGGFIENIENRARVSFVFNQAQKDQLSALRTNLDGKILFDPTLSRALRLAQAEETLLDHINKGGIWALPIIAFALFATVISLLKALQIWRLPKPVPALVERLIAYADAGDEKAYRELSEKTEGMQGELLNVVNRYEKSQRRDDQLFACLLVNKNKLENWLGAIAITAAVSPLLGLLGTVSGMIEAFRLMTLFGAGDPAAVSSGISEALVTTELGLIVAIPSLVLHALLSRSAKSYYSQLESFAFKLSQLQTCYENTHGNVSQRSPVSEQETTNGPLIPQGAAT